jgi:hypothetical protein
MRDNSNRGANWVFTRSSGVWSQLGSKLTVSGIQAESYLGDCVAISGDGKTILSGAEGYLGGVGGGFVFAMDSIRVVAHWSLDETSGSVAFDSSGWGNHGSAYGTTIIPGVNGNARRFDGAGDYGACAEPFK